MSQYGFQNFKCFKPSWGKSVFVSFCQFLSVFSFWARNKNPKKTDSVFVSFCQCFSAAVECDFHFLRVFGGSQKYWAKIKISFLFFLFFIEIKNRKNTEFYFGPFLFNELYNLYKMNDYWVDAGFTDSVFWSREQIPCIPSAPQVGSQSAWQHSSSLSVHPKLQSTAYSLLAYHACWRR